MRNHITALSLSAALALTLTACGGGSAAPSTEPSAPAAPVQSATGSAIPGLEDRKSVV